MAYRTGPERAPEYDWFRDTWELLSPATHSCQIEQSHRRIAGCFFADSKISNCAARRGEKEIERTPEDGLYITLYSQGSLRFRSRDAESVLRAGDILLWETGTKGAFDCRDSATGQTILFPRNMLERRLGKSQRLSAIQPDPRDPRTALMRSHFQALHQLAGHTDESVLRALLETSLDLAYLCLVRDGDIADDQPAYTAIERDIAEHLASDDLSPLATAQRLGMSVRRLQQILYARGTTFTGLVAELRVERASEMLRSPAFCSHSISEIALSLGFYDSAHFSNTFKRNKGISPRQYRKLH
ncbi:MAG: helix-turn-helix domain-containing protein [Novosphingobium sp.]|nr:helix-turn-helix domain-containing protein [Novosphingobium sp.]